MSCSVVARPEIVKNIGDSIWYIENINIRCLPTYIGTEHPRWESVEGPHQ